MAVPLLSWNSFAFFPDETWDIPGIFRRDVVLICHLCGQLLIVAVSEQGQQKIVTDRFWSMIAETLLGSRLLAGAWDPSQTAKRQTPDQSKQQVKPRCQTRTST